MFRRLIGTQVPGKPLPLVVPPFFTREPRVHVYVIAILNVPFILRGSSARSSRRPAILNYLPTRSSRSSLYGHRFDQTRDTKKRDG